MVWRYLLVQSWFRNRDIIMCDVMLHVVLLIIRDQSETKLDLEEGQRLWECEFCGHDNIVDIEDAELPKV